VKFYCIADEDTVRGFRLAGIAGQSVTTLDQAAAAVRQAVTQTEWGVIILTERLAASIRQQVEAIRMERDRPLIVEIPGPEGPLPGRKSLRQFVQEAVGIRVGPEGGA
jgi:V/A-type H+-transporting ATPase subunit F